MNGGAGSSAMESLSMILDDAERCEEGIRMLWQVVLFLFVLTGLHRIILLLATHAFFYCCSSSSFQSKVSAAFCALLSLLSPPPEASASSSSSSSSSSASAASSFPDLHARKVLRTANAQQGGTTATATALTSFSPTAAADAAESATPSNDNSNEVGPISFLASSDPRRCRAKKKRSIDLSTKEKRCSKESSPVLS
ncbi:hypothetical protein FN846DRAFT_328589 [Sphaerosporella brunnea]|uniref:Uncharacterized protein n=1 Tax=Sphaerosporella brunnea TaxID=1250544 RepID=A0A5J5EIR0_9PEZI|nr:hypothetical protein FN846DRAFT_328589 [Sphaerosporella brunnea]